MSKKVKFITLIILIISIGAISAVVFIKLPSKDTKEDYRLKNPTISNNVDIPIPRPEKKLNIHEIDDATFNRYIDEITKSFIHIESEIGTYDSREWYDKYMEMEVNSYYKGENLYKVNAYDKNMNFEIYYWNNEVVFVLAVPDENKGETTENGEIIGYRMFFIQNTMIASMDLEGNSVDPDSEDFKTMEDFTLRLSYYFIIAMSE